MSTTLFMVLVHNTGEYSCFTRASLICRTSEYELASQLCSIGICGGLNSTLAIALATFLLAFNIKLQCDGTDTANVCTFFAPLSFKAIIACSTLLLLPAITTCPTELKLTGATTNPALFSISAQIVMTF